MQAIRLLRAFIYAPLIAFVVMGSYVFSERPQLNDRYGSEDSRD
jgi:hypothetical protein